MSTITDALSSANLNDSLAPVKLQYHHFPFGCINKSASLGKRTKDVEEDEKFLQSLFSNFQVHHIDIEDIELGGAANKDDRWALSMLEPYADKAYGFIEPIMVPKNVGFDMVPFYFVYDPTLKRFEMKIGLGVDIVESFNTNGVVVEDSELKGINAYTTIIRKYLENTPVIIVVIRQKLPLFEYTDYAWRYSAIQKDPVTMEKLRDYIDGCDYKPKDDKYYFIRSKIVTNKNGHTDRYYWLEKKGRYNKDQEEKNTSSSDDDQAE